MMSESIVAARSLLLKKKYTDIYNLRYIKPIDEEWLCSICRNYSRIIIVEDGIKPCGIGETIEIILRRNKMENIKVLAFPEKFISQGTRQEVLQEAGLASGDIENA